MKILIILIILTISACFPQKSKNTTPKENLDDRANELTTGEKLPLLRIVIGGDDMWFSRTELSAERYFEIGHNKNTYHVFFDPANEDQFNKVNENHAVKHAVTESQLITSIAKVIKLHRPQRVVFFLVAHGAQNGGKLCYRSKNSCTFGASEFGKLFTLLDNNNNARAEDEKLQHALIVATSCYNRTLKNGIFADPSLKNKNFALSMLHMELEREALSIDFGQDIFWRQISVVAEVPEPGQETVAEKMTRLSRSERMFDITTLDEKAWSRASIFKNIMNFKEEVYNNYTTASNREDIEVNLDTFEIRPTVLVFETYNFASVPALLTPEQVSKQITINELIQFFFGTEASLLSRIKTVKLLDSFVDRGNPRRLDLENGDDILTITGDHFLEVEIDCQNYL